MNKRSRASSKANKKGQAGEDIATNALKRIGCLMVEEIGTPFKITNRKTFGGRTWLQGFWKAKVAGDRRAVRRDGISILAETKTITEGNLVWSNFKEHQPDKLDEHAQYAISLVVWVKSIDEVFIMRWPIPGFGPKKSITPQAAKLLDITNIDYETV